MIRTTRAGGEQASASVAICPNPIFVVGCPRSGTSVLAHSLARHSRLWLGQESDFIAPLARSARELHAFATRRGKYQWLSGQEVSMEEWLRYIGIGVNALYTERSGGLRWVEQTPQYTLSLPDIALMYPGARFIHIVRDARDVVLSMTRSGFDIAWAYDFEEACRTWVKFVEAALNFESENRTLILRVHHEALVRNRREGFERILRFLGLPYEESVAELVGSKRMNSSFDGPEEARPRWEELFSTAQQEFLFHVCGELLTCLGYGTKASLPNQDPCPAKGRPGGTGQSPKVQIERTDGSTTNTQRKQADRPDSSQVFAENQLLKSEINALTRRLDLISNQAVRLTEMGEELFSRGHEEEALELFRSLSVLAPQSALNWNNLGVSLLQSGDRSGAITAFRKAIEIDSSLRVARENYLEIGGSHQRPAGEETDGISRTGQQMKAEKTT